MAKTRLFFKDPAIDKYLNKKTKQGLCRWGAYVRRTARQSMRKSKKPAPPGSPPHVHEGSLKRLLNFYYDRVTRTVVCGPEIRPGNATGAPNVMEFGGVKIHQPPNRQFKIGETGPVRELYTMGGAYRLVFARLKSQGMVDRANTLYKKYRNFRTRNYKILARPYMKPALLKNLHVAPKGFNFALRGK